MIKSILGYTLWIIAIVGMIALCTSCRSVKQITKTETIVDSTAISEKIDSIRMLKDAISFYEETIKNIEQTGIVFDTLYRDTGRVITNKVVVRSDGTIEAEGRIKSLNITKDHQKRIISSQQETIDSLAVENERKEIELSKKATEKVVYKERRYIPWWLVVAIGLVTVLYVLKLARNMQKFPTPPPKPVKPIPPKQGL